MKISVLAVINIKKLRYKAVTENVKQLSSSNKSKKSAHKVSQVSKLNIKEVKDYYEPYRE